MRSWVGIEVGKVINSESVSHVSVMCCGSVQHIIAVELTSC